MAKSAANVKIGKVVQYGAISFEIKSAQKAAECHNGKSQPGSLFLVIELKAENTKSQSTAFIVPDEEMWLTCKEGELLKPENYKFETALDARKPSEGAIWYAVPEGAKKFSLMFGKRTLPKLPVDFEM
ncbi:MAG: DUF4352 domain-containing protein [Candidatus Micrarchaeia archaeon]